MDGGEFSADTGEFDVDTGELPNDIKAAIDQLGRRPRRENLRPVIRAICDQGRWVTAATLARYLSLKQENLIAGHLGEMVRNKELERRFSDKPNHPRQAYRAIAPQRPHT